MEILKLMLYRLLQIKLLFNLFQSISRRIQALYFVVSDSFAIKAQAAKISKSSLYFLLQIASWWCWIYSTVGQSLNRW
jgi:hypothetical protein